MNAQTQKTTNHPTTTFKRTLLKTTQTTIQSGLLCLKALGIGIITTGLLFFGTPMNIPTANAQPTPSGLPLPPVPIISKVVLNIYGYTLRMGVSHDAPAFTWHKYLFRDRDGFPIWENVNFTYNLSYVGEYDWYYCTVYRCGDGLVLYDLAHDYSVWATVNVFMYNGEFEVYVTDSDGNHYRPPLEGVPLGDFTSSP